MPMDLKELKSHADTLVYSGKQELIDFFQFRTRVFAASITFIDEIREQKHKTGLCVRTEDV